jgi:hypothetical protein
MAVFADPGGAAISAWQPISMPGFQTEGANAYSWAELNARNVGASLPFYRDVFGWTLHPSDSPDMPYTEFQIDGTSIAGATERVRRLRVEMPNWLVRLPVSPMSMRDGIGRRRRWRRCWR